MARPKKNPALEEYRLQSIREAATRVVAREGVADATMQKFADEAGVAKGTLYLYFKDRNALLESVSDVLFGEVLAGVEEIFRRKQSFEVSLRELIETDIRFFDENHELLRFYHEMVERNRGSRKHRECHPVHTEYMAALTSFMDKAMRRREIRRQDPGRLAIFISEGIISLLLRRLMESHPPPIKDDVDLIAGTILHGVQIERREV